MKKLSVLF